VPGHEVVGVVDELGEGTSKLRVGDRVGAAWLAHTCGPARFCLAEKENLCLDPTFTGWDIDGGYATYVVVREDYIYRLPEGFDDAAVRPCSVRGSSVFAPYVDGTTQGRPSRDLRLWWLSAPHRSNRHRRGSSRSRNDTRSPDHTRARPRPRGGERG